MVYVAALEAPKMTIYLLQTAEIAALKQNKASSQVWVKNSDFSDDFLVEKTLVLLEQTKLNKHIIKLKDEKQSFYRPIYNLRLVELETLNMYLETHLKTSIIQSSKSPATVLIFVDKKRSNSFWFCINY